MKLILLFCLMLPMLTAFSQKLISYDFYFGYLGLPGGYSASEHYTKTGNNYGHHYAEHQPRRIINIDRPVLLHRKMDDAVVMLDSLSRLGPVVMYLSEKEMEMVLAQESLMERYHLTRDEAEKYLKENRDFYFRPNEFNKIIGVDSFYYSPFNEFMVIDGAPFAATINAEYADGKKFEYYYQANLVDDVFNDDIYEWVIFYQVYKKYHCFRKLPLDYYFNEEKYYELIIRTISHQLGK